MVFIVKLLFPIPKIKASSVEMNTGQMLTNTNETDDKAKPIEQALVKDSSTVKNSGIYAGQKKAKTINKSMIDELNMEAAVKWIFVEMKITSDFWCTTRDNKSYLVEFYVMSTDELDAILDKLASYNVGKDANSLIIVNEASASVVPAIKPIQQSNDTHTSKTAVTTFNKFLNSLKSRLTVAQVYHAISQRGDFTIDYLAFIICAAVLADVALVTQRPPVIVASMLLSPMMDPILCVLFGFRLREKKLILKGIRNTLISISICFLVGILLGIVTHSVATFEEVTPYPTDEIKSRGTLNYLPNTAIVTVFSGVSTAFAILNNVVSAMIGNAISLSILPPAVNSGHLIFLSLLATVDRYKNLSPANSSNGIQCNFDWIKNYKMIYFKHTCDYPIEFAINSAISMTVTIMNITCILVIGYIVCIVKDFAPNALTNEESKKFYTEDIKEVQEASKTIGYQDLDPTKLAQEAFEEYKRCLGITNTDADTSVVAEDFSTVLAAVEEDPHYQNIKGKLSEHIDLGAQIREITQTESSTSAAEATFTRQFSMLPHHHLNHLVEEPGTIDPVVEDAVNLMRRPHTISMSSYERQKMIRGVARKMSKDYGSFRLSTKKEEDAHARTRKKSDFQKRKLEGGIYEVNPANNI